MTIDVARTFSTNTGGVLSVVAGMLRIWQVSGQELPAISMDEISNVRELKALLRSLHGFPTCMQKLLHNGNTMDNSTKLDAPIGLQLVLLTLSTAVQQIEAAEELTAACVQGDLKIARLLLEAGVDKNARNAKSSSTALMLAAANGHVEIARLLLEAGADKHLQSGLSGHGYTALMLAAEKGHVEIARLLLEADPRPKLASRPVSGYTALMLAAKNGYEEIVRLLLDTGADKDLKNLCGYTALMLAAENGHMKISRLLLDAGADKDQKNGIGKTALMFAAGNGHVEIVRQLLAAGADKQLKDGYGKTALMFAAENDYTKMARLLLDTGPTTLPACTELGKKL